MQTESEEDMHYLKYVAAKPTGPIKVDVLLDSKPVSMELDTGAPVSLMSRKMLELDRKQCRFTSIDV